MISGEHCVQQRIILQLCVIVTSYKNAFYLYFILFTLCPSLKSVKRLHGIQTKNIYFRILFKIFYVQRYIYAYIRIIFQILFPYMLLQNIVYSSLYCTVGPCYLPIWHIGVCICCSLIPLLPLLPTFPFGNRKFVFYVCEPIPIL